jgi:hypothetical protein
VVILSPPLKSSTYKNQSCQRCKSSQTAFLAGIPKRSNKKAGDTITSFKINNLAKSIAV